MNSNIIRLALALLLLLCLFNLPYGLYELFRFIFFIGFAYLAYEADESKKKKETFIYVALAILFQPLIKIALGRTIWNVIDTVVAIGLLYEIIKSQTPKKEL